MTKIIWGVNIPVQSTKIDWEATDRKRKEIFDRTGDKPYFLNNIVRVPCIRINKEMSFTLCDICGEAVPENRAHRRITTCCPAHNKIKNERWRSKTIEEERELKGERPIFFWQTIRSDCFKRDGWKCQTCGKDIRTEDKPGEAHHIIPIAKGGSNEIENLKTLCYDCHKEEHSHTGNAKRKHVSLGTWIE